MLLTPSKGFFKFVKQRGMDIRTVKNAVSPMKQDQPFVVFFALERLRVGQTDWYIDENGYRTNQQIELILSFLSGLYGLSKDEDKALREALHAYGEAAAAGLRKWGT